MAGPLPLSVHGSSGVQLGDHNVQFNVFLQASAADTPGGRTVDLAEAAATGPFFGRERELETLRGWLADGCRAVVVTARGGMGKTALAARLVRQVARNYDVVLWRSVYNCQPMPVFLRDLLGVLLPDRVFDGNGGLLDAFGEVLRERRCLVVLDNLESLLAGGGPGEFLGSYADYDDLLAVLTAPGHHGQTLLTTRETPASLTRRRDAVRVLSLGGLDERAGRHLIRSRNLAATDHDGARIAAVYGGNPLELSIAADNIRLLYGGDVQSFLDDGVTTGGDTHTLLARQVDRLDPLVASVLCWLAIRREPATSDELNDCLNPQPGGKRRVLDALGVLVGRSLAATARPGAFTVQPVIAEFMVERLLDAAYAELRSARPDVFSRFALAQAGGKDYVRTAQDRVLVRPLAGRLLNNHGVSDLSRMLRRMLDALRAADGPSNGYGAANVLHLALAAGVEVTGYDLSGLTVRQAHLQGVALRKVSFRETRFVRTAFTDTFGVVQSVAAAPDGELIAAGTDAGDVRLWRRTDGQAVATWHEHLNLVNAVAFSADGRWLASAGADRTVRVWELRTGRCVRVLHGHANAVEDVAWHPDGSLLATAGLDNTVRLWNPATGEQLHVFTEHSNWVEQVTFSADGGLLASASRDGTVRVWDPPSRSCVGVLVDRGESLLCVAVSPDASLIAAGDYDGRVSVWDWPQGTPRQVPFAHNARVWSVAFLDRERLASAGEDRLVRLWDCATGASAGRLEGHRLGVGSVRPIGRTRQVVTGSADQTVRVWDVAAGTCHLELEGFEQPMRTVAVSPAADLIVAAGNDGALHRWTADGRYLGTWTGHTEAVDCVAFNATGDRLASCGNDRTIRLWDVALGRCVQVLAGHEGYVYEVAFSPDGHRLSSGGQFGQVLNWDTTTGRRIFAVTPFRSTAGPIRYTPDGRLLVVAGGDHRSSLYLCDPSNGDHVALLQDDHLGGCDAIAVTPDGRHVVACVAGLVDVWDIATRRRVGWFPGHRGVARAVVCHPDNRTISTAGDDGVIRIWRIGDPACRAELVGHTQSVWGLACMPDGERLLSASMDGTARIWSPDGTLLRILVPPRPYEGVDITGATGLSEAQRVGLRTLGAVENAV